MTVLIDPIKNRANNQVRETENLIESKHVSNDANNNVGICEAIDCFAKAANTIKVEVGNNRTISLSLCNICLKKFV